jgi:carbonic anhydrase
MENLSHLFDSNKAWAAAISKNDPTFFKKLSQQQTPEYLWIGCSDSRVPANEIVNLLPGELFVHRNVANLVVHTDLNCLAVIQYAVEVLKVKHIIVCGHYGCGGVISVIKQSELGLINNWLRHLEDIVLKRPDEFSSIKSEMEKVKKLSELNVQSQVENVCRTTIVQEAWKRNQPLTVHGWIYDIKDGLLQNIIGDSISDSQQLNRFLSQF